MVEAAEAKYEQEIRFAVVLYGGVSLAIYMNGIAQELLRMVRGTAKLPEDEELKGTELIYRELGQIIGLDGPRKDLTPDPEDTKTYPIRSRFVVDIISGTSAGGINGVALAKALALKCRNLDALKNTWLEEAQLDLLLNDKKSDQRKYPVGSKTTSLLNSERMYGKILETLLAMNDPAKCTADAADFADKLDLFVTATDLAGLETRIQLTGHTIKERVHRAVFHFEYPPVCPENEKSENQFDREHDPMLAFAARCTSSFPAAFEPVRFDHIKNQVEKH
ncbi:MAG TPA: patatin-like protein, partial [Methyloceanibacter sp.]|nr:patatin-like protein [Methyloceanibacter sp.]